MSLSSSEKPIEHRSANEMFVDTLVQLTQKGVKYVALADGKLTGECSNESSAPLATEGKVWIDLGGDLEGGDLLSLRSAFFAKGLTPEQLVKSLIPQAETEPKSDFVPDYNLLKKVQAENSTKTRKFNRRAFIGTAAAAAAGAAYLFRKKSDSSKLTENSPSKTDKLPRRTETADVYNTKLSIYDSETNTEVKSHVKVSPEIAEYFKQTIRTFVKAYSSVIRPDVRINLNLPGLSTQNSKQKIIVRGFKEPKAIAPRGIFGDRAVSSVSEIQMFFDAGDFEQLKSPADEENQKRIIFSEFAKYFFILGSRIEEFTQSGKTENNDKKRVEFSKIFQLVFPGNVVDQDLLIALGLEKELNDIPFQLKFPLGLSPIETGQNQDKPIDPKTVPLTEETIEKMVNIIFELSAKLVTEMHFQKDFAKKLSKITDLDLRNRAFEVMGLILDLTNTFIANKKESGKIINEIIPNYEKNREIFNKRVVTIKNGK